MSNNEDIYSTENLEVRYANGDFITSLNSDLVKKQKLSADDIELLKSSHVMRAMIFRVMRNTDNKAVLKRFAKMFKNLEYLQQGLWKFKIDKSFHQWFDVPKCSCPKLDNRELNGTETCIIDFKCIVHGGNND